MAQSDHEFSQAVESQGLWTAHHRRLLVGHVAAHGFSNLFYVARLPQVHQAADLIDQRREAWPPCGRRGYPMGNRTTGGVATTARIGERTLMTYDEILSRITIDPNVCFGKPCVRGHRIWVSLVLDFLASGWSIPEILANYPGLEEEDIRACIAYGAEMSRERYVEIGG